LVDLARPRGAIEDVPVPLFVPPRDIDDLACQFGEALGSSESRIRINATGNQAGLQRLKCG
jgi:hypothetical protein